MSQRAPLPAEVASEWDFLLGRWLDHPDWQAAVERDLTAFFTGRERGPLSERFIAALAIDRAISSPEQKKTEAA